MLLWWILLVSRPRFVGTESYIPVLLYQELAELSIMFISVGEEWNLIQRLSLIEVGSRSLGVILKSPAFYKLHVQVYR